MEMTNKIGTNNHNQQASSLFLQGAGGQQQSLGWNTVTNQNMFGGMFNPMSPNIEPRLGNPSNPGGMF